MKDMKKITFEELDRESNEKGAFFTFKGAPIARENADIFLVGYKEVELKRGGVAEWSDEYGGNAVVKYDK